jgi:hypothetical protein
MQTRVPRRQFEPIAALRAPERAGELDDRHYRLQPGLELRIAPPPQ